MPMSLMILKDECPRYCSFIVSPRKYRYILLWIGGDVNNKYYTTVSKMVKLWHKSGQFGGKKHLFGWKSGFFQKVVDFLLFI